MVSNFNLIPPNSGLEVWYTSGALAFRDDGLIIRLLRGGYMYIPYFGLVVFPRFTRNPVGWIDCVAWRLALSKILVACGAKRSSRSDLLDASMVASELNTPC
jgi:hypothetical protein